MGQKRSERETAPAERRQKRRVWPQRSEKESASAENEPYTPISLSTALVALMNYSADSGTAFSTVTRMTPGYLAASSLTDPVRLAPAWLVETDAATLCIDAATGEVSRAE